jgi:hypothetical protein
MIAGTAKPLSLSSFSLRVGVPRLNVNSHMVTGVEQIFRFHFSMRELTRFLFLLVLGLILLILCPQKSILAQSSISLPPRPDTIRAERGSPQDDGPPLTTVEEEMRAKRAIKYAEKEHMENLARATQISDLGKQLAASFKQKKVLDRDDLRKLERLEKLTRKIRSEAGGEDDEKVLAKRPTDLAAAMNCVGEVAQSVGKQFRQTPRQVVSAGVIDEANVLLELIKVVRAMLQPTN